MIVLFFYLHQCRECMNGSIGVKKNIVCQILNALILCLSYINRVYRPTLQPSILVYRLFLTSVQEKLLVTQSGFEGLNFDDDKSEVRQLGVE